MFSIPLPSPLNNVLSASFMPRGKGAEAPVPVQVADDGGVSQPVQLASAADDPLADLDQRVRSIGEW